MFLHSPGSKECFLVCKEVQGSTVISSSGMLYADSAVEILGRPRAALETGTQDTQTLAIHQLLTKYRAVENKVWLKGSFPLAKCWTKQCMWVKRDQ